ncbi:MAG: hypothetical protein ABI869_05250 [Actinomycetota bacterium]
MTLESVPPDEMGAHDHDDELDDIFEELRTAFPARPVAAEDEHVAGMIAAAHLQADKGDPVTRPASNANAPAVQVSWLPKQRRNRMSDRNWSRRLAPKILAPVVVLFTMLGGVAWAGGLPQPLQKTASHVAGFAGLTVDDGSDETDATEVETPDPTETDSQDPTSTDNQDGDNQGEDTQDTTPGQDDQGDDNQGSTTSDSSGENDQGSSSVDDNQGDNTQDSTSGDNSQGEDTQDSGSNDNSGDSSGDSGSGSDGSGGDSQD